VLAAGEGLRFGLPKAAVVVHGERLVDRAVRVLRETGCDPVLVVLGAWVDDVPGAERVLNPDWSSGMGSSLRRGLEALAEQTVADRALVTLVDLPGLTPTAVARVLASGAGLAAATYRGAQGHPVLLAREHWSGAAASAEGDRGARSYLAAHAGELELVEVGDVADGTDVDRPSDLTGLTQRTQRTQVDAP
jgi:nicotine blue oxidoreductase